MNSNTSPIVAFRQFGFAVLPAFFPTAQHGPLRQSCDRALARVRQDNRETAHSTPRISLLADGCDVGHDALLLSPIIEFATSPRVCALLRALTDDGRAAPRVEEVHYYHEQTKRDWDGDWHRDSQFGRPDPELERAFIETTTAVRVHVRVAFEDDDRLEIVPGSHARWDTPEELRIRRGADRAAALMPRATRIQLRAGDGCLFHAWSIHRATYRCAPIRRTLDVLYG